MFLRFAKYWLPVLAWMSVIFAASTDLGATRHTSRFIGPFLRWFNPEITDNTVYAIQFAIRKAGHVTEYAILSLLIWRALRNRAASGVKGWASGDAKLAVILCGLYAITDELHQKFVGSRQASGWDVLLDTCGAALGVAALWAWGKWRRRW